MYSIFKKCTGTNNLFDDLLNISIKGVAAFLKYNLTSNYMAQSMYFLENDI